jgi:hypothetical protein
MREVWPRNWGSLGAAEWMIIGFEGVLFWGSFWWVLILIGYVCLCRVRTDNRAILGIRARARREMRRGVPELLQIHLREGSLQTRFLFEECLV